MTPKKDYVVGSGNVFADLNVPHPEEALAKAELAHKITTLIEHRGMTQVEAAKLLWSANRPSRRSAARPVMSQSCRSTSKAGSSQSRIRSTHQAICAAAKPVSLGST